MKNKYIDQIQKSKNDNVKKPNLQNLHMQGMINYGIIIIKVEQLCIY